MSAAQQPVDALSESLEREARFRLIAEACSDWFWETDASLRMVNISERFFEITGLGHDAILGRTREQIASKKELDREPDKWRRHLDDLAHRRPFRDFEYRLTRADGRRVTIRLSGAPRFDANGVFLGYIGGGADVTAHRATEERQRQILLELDAIFTHASVGIVYSRQRVIQRCNPRAAEILGYTAAELVGQPGITIYPNSEAYDRLGRDAGPLLSAGHSFTTECQFKRKDGKLVWCRTFAKAYDPEDTQSGTIWILEDIEETRCAQAALAATLRELEAIMDNASVGILFTRDGIMLRHNPKFAEMFGSDGMIGRPARVLFESDAAYEALGRSAYPLLSVGRPFHSEMLARRQDGTLFCAEVIGYLIDPANPPHGTIWILNDIEARRQAQEQLKAALRELEAIMVNASVGILLTRDRKIQRHNRKFGEMFGFAGDEALQRPARVLYRSDEEYAAVGQVAGPLLSTAQPFQTELFMRAQDGSDLWINLIGYVSDPEHPTEGTIWILEDRTDFKRADEALHRSHAELEKRVVERTAELSQQLHFLQQLIEAIPGPVFYKDAEARYLGCNRAFEKFIGIEARDLIGKTPHDIAPPALADAYLAADRELLDHPGSQIYESQVCYSTGELRDVMFHKATFTRPDGAVGGLVGVILDITERKRTEELLRLTRISVEAASDALFWITPDARIVDVNAAACRTLGYTREELLHLSVPDIDIRHSAEAWPEHFAVLRRQGSLTFESTQRTKDGRLIPVEIVANYVQVGNEERNCAFVRDISERKLTEQNLRVAATTFESQEGMIITDANEVILRVNRAFSEITGYNADEAVGRTPRLLASGRHDAAFFAAMWESIARTGSWQGELWCRRKSGEVYPQSQTITAVKGDNGQVTHYVGTFADITERKVAEEEIRDLAFYDPLTRLPNRRLLLDRLRHTLTGLDRNPRAGALMFIDLDNFKTLNDTRGHDIGDRLLIDVARRLQSLVRQGDTVARLGGDEFVVMLEDLEPGGMAAAQAEAVAVKILAGVNQPYRLQRGGEASTSALTDYRCTASIGITLYRAGRESVDELLKQADLAMYQAKAAGRNALRFFDPAMQAAAIAGAALEVDLRHGLNDRQFLLYYQAQVDGQERLTGVEALVRWLHPQRGLVAPAEFIPLAEETGLILPLGHWVLETACAQLVAWAKDPVRAHLTIAVNVSVRQFRHQDFADQVLAVLDRSGARPERLKLELTESLLTEDVEDIIAKMIKLKNRGVGFALDDFGTGYSSLAYLKRLPLDQLKIDQSFVRDVLTDPNDGAISRTIVALGQSLGLEVIAEGVETEAQRDFLAGLGCHAYQGYFFGRPLPIEEFEASGH